LATALRTPLPVNGGEHRTGVADQAPAIAGVAAGRDGVNGLDPGAPAHQVGLGPLEDDDVVAGPVQECRGHASGDRAPDMPTLIPLAPDPLDCHPGR